MRRARSQRSSVCAVLAIVTAVNAATGAAGDARNAKPAAEFSVQKRSSLAVLELEVTQPGDADASVVRQSISDMVLFVSRQGADATKLLAAADGEVPEAATGKSSVLFSVRVFIVAAGKLHTGLKAQCGAWANDVSRCAAPCEAGTFAIRRKASAPLELLFGAIPGGSAGDGDGISLAGCSLEDGGADMRLRPKPGQALAVVGFGDD